MKIVLLGVVIVAVVFGIRWVMKKLRQRHKRLPPLKIPHDANIYATPLLDKEEVALYNLLRLVVQERYLVLAQVPLWSFLVVDAAEKDRSTILRHIALKRVDFVLVHPGSCQVEQVVQIDRDSPEDDEAEGQQTIESVVTAAGIKLVRLPSKKSCSLPDLTARLELGVEE